MSKTPEEMAEEFSNVFRSERKKTIAKKSWYTGFEAGLKYASAKWISVKDRLPEHFEDVLTFEDGEFYSVNSISQLTKYWWDSDEGFERHPSHWMPLPEAPKEEK